MRQRQAAATRRPPERRCREESGRFPAPLSDLSSPLRGACAGWHVMWVQPVFNPGRDMPKLEAGYQVIVTVTNCILSIGARDFGSRWITYLTVMYTTCYRHNSSQA